MLGYLVVLPAFFFAYYCIVLAEEEFLRRKFGPDYDVYCREVNRFIPTPGKMRWVFEGGYFDMKRVIRKDYTSAFYWFILALAMMGWEAIAHQGWEASRGRLEVLGGIWAAGLVVWIIARVLKARKILASPD
jgi:hypothetical protein